MSQDQDNPLNKLHQLRSAFSIAQKAMPFLEQIFGFIQEVEPLLNEVNHSIRETTSKMPRATSRLESVSEATELATTEIMDLIDEVFQTAEKLEGNRATYHERTDRLREMDEAFLERLHDELDADEHADLLEEAEDFTRRKGEMCDACRAGIDGEQIQLSDLEDKLNRIMMSLQVQDITSQQIKAVNHLIYEIRDRMTGLLDNLDQDSVLDKENMDRPDPETFNGKARYHRSGNHQRDADEVISSFGNKTTPSIGADEIPSQDDIDALFDGNQVETSNEETASSDDTPDPALASTENTQASQNDIDDLFGSTATDKDDSEDEPAPENTSPAQNGEKASQDDIDALFN